MCLGGSDLRESPYGQAPKCRYSTAKARRTTSAFSKVGAPTNRVVNSRIIFGAARRQQGVSVLLAGERGKGAETRWPGSICNPHGAGWLLFDDCVPTRKEVLNFDVGAGLSFEPCDNRNSERVTLQTPRVGVASVSPYLTICAAPSRFQAVFADRSSLRMEISARDGNHSPATAPRSESPAQTPIAAEKLSLNAFPESGAARPANTAPTKAIPNTPPRYRIRLNVPDALPISPAPTELNTACWAAGMAIDTPQPARSRGGTN